MKIAAWMLAIPLFIVAIGSAGPPRIENAILESADLQGSLSSEVATWSATVGEPSWMGWHVPMIEGDSRLCCWTRGDRRRPDKACALESSHRHLVFSSDRPDFSLDGSAALVILLRAVHGRVDEMRIFSEGCRLAAGGQAVTWLEGVDPEESVELLSQWIEGDSVVKDEALMAMALHASPIAADRLAEMARQSADRELRGAALFWLSHTGADNASEVVLQALAEDPDARVRDEAVFALSQLPNHQGMPLLLEILRDRSRPAEIREEAFFWYVQSGDDQALDLIAEILSD